MIFSYMRDLITAPFLFRVAEDSTFLSRQLNPGLLVRELLHFPCLNTRRYDHTVRTFFRLLQGVSLSLFF
jgi:hypothetical protein